MKVELKNDSTFYNLSNDHLFKEVFRKEENLKILLQDFFGITVSKIVYKNGETLKKNKKDKYGVIDILIEINGDINCIMEMQNGKERGFKNRLLKYMGAIICSDSLKESEDYDKLKDTKALAIVNFSKKKYRKYIEAKLRDDKGEIFNDKIEFKIINLKNYDKDNALYKMLTCKSLEEIKEYKENNKYKKIYEMIEYYNLNEEERCKMDMVAKMLEEERFNYDEALEYGRMEGMKKGLKEGLKEGKKAGMEAGMKVGKKAGMEAGMEAGMKVGIKTGEINGKKIEKLEIAKKLLSKTNDYEYISEITDIPVLQLKKMNQVL